MTDLGADLAAAILSRKKTATMTFRGAALAFQTYAGGEAILSGPAETGKTYAGLWRLDSMLRDTPKVRAVLARKVRADMGGSVLGTWDRVASMRGMPAAFGGSSPAWYDYPNGSRLWIVGLDRPGKVLSGEFDVIYVNQAEELVLGDWETLATRVTGRGAVLPQTLLCGDCNPGPTQHWIREREKKGALRLLESKHEDNPTLWDGSAWTEQGRRTLAVLDSLTGVRYDRLRLGLWRSAEGAVYNDFDYKVHIVDRFDVPPEWRRIRSIDFGYTNPSVVQWWAVDPDGRMHLYREIYRTQQLAEDMAREILRLSAGERIEATVADHDAEDRATMARHGIQTVPAQKAVSLGIQAVQARMRTAGDGKPRLYILRDSLVRRDEALSAARRPVCTAEEFEVYSWPKDVNGRALKEEPVKTDDHGMDALRYAVMHLENAVASSAAAVRTTGGQRGRAF